MVRALGVRTILEIKNVEVIKLAKRGRKRKEEPEHWGD
jgi:hypothetical protein